MSGFVRTCSAALFVILLVLTVGCGGDDDDPSGGDGATATLDASPAETSEGETETPEAGDDNGDSAELEHYFAEMEDIATHTDDRLEDIGAELDAATFDTDEEELQITRDGVQEIGETIETALLNISDIEPPPEAESAHADFFDALNDVLVLFASLAADIEDATTSAELDAVTEQYNEPFADADATFDETCIALQEIADDHGIEADMRCTD